MLALFSSSSSFSTLRENQNDRKSETYILFILLQAAFSPNYRLKRRFTSELNLWHACVKKKGGPSTLWHAGRAAHERGGAWHCCGPRATRHRTLTAVPRPASRPAVVARSARTRRATHCTADRCDEPAQRRVAATWRRSPPRCFNQPAHGGNDHIDAMLGAQRGTQLD